jgi:hypothetical protein
MILDESIEIQAENMQLTDKEIFTNIWTSPRLVFKYLNENRYDKFVNLLLVLGGISGTFNNASTRNMGDNFPLIAVIAICIILGGLIGWIGYYIYAALLSWTGRWINGRGDTKSLLRVVSHAMIPAIFSMVLLIPQIIICGNGIFQSDFDILNNSLSAVIFFYLTILLELILGIWATVILVVGLSEIQKLSIGKSILNMILPGLIIVVPLVIIALLIN